MRITAFIISLYIISFALPASAQFTNQALTPEVGITLFPTNPKPGEEATATISNHQSLYGSAISWFVDGVEQSMDANKNSITLTAGQAGKKQTIEAVFTKPSGERVALQKTFTPLYLDIVIEPQTRVPDFYRGRSLPSIGSTVNATAVVSGHTDTNNLMYRWRVNRDVIGGGSLRGKNQVSFTVPMGFTVTIAVEVTDLSGTIIAGRTIEIPSVEPELHFYEVNSLYGVNQRAVDQGLNLSGNSALVRAEPYYLDTRVYNNPTFAEWEVARQKTVNQSNPYEATIERFGFSGSATINFHVRDTTQVLQGAKGAMQVNF